MDLIVAVRSLMGETVLAPVNIQPQEKLAVDVASLLKEQKADVNGAFAEGSIAVYFEGTIMPLAGQLTMTNPALSLVHESEMVENDPGHSDIPPVLNGLWWGIGGGRDARIMVSNTAGQPVMADVFLDFQGNRHESATLSFLANETKVLSITRLLGDLNASPAQAPEGGITILTRGPKPTLIANGRILDPATGFSTSLNFPLPQVQRVSALHASGVPIGKPTPESPFAKMGTFVPHVVVRNLAGSTQIVTVTVEYPSPQKEPQEPAAPLQPNHSGAPDDPIANQDGSHSPATAQMALAPLSLAPYSTVDFSLGSAMGQLPLPLPYCSIRIQYSGPPGSAVAEVSSVEQKSDMVIDSRLANEGDGWAGSGAHPWHLDDETQSILFLTDESDQPARIGFQVQANGVHYYLTKLRLNPHETRAIDLRKLRNAQHADFRWNKIPLNATDGSVLWIRLDNVSVNGRLVVIKRQGGMASNYDCNTCPCPANYVGCDITPPPPSCLGPHAIMQCTCKETTQDCNANYYYFDVTQWATWTSDNTAVATFDSTTVGLLRAHAAGSAHMKATYTGNIYRQGCGPYGCNCYSNSVTYSYSCPISVTNSGCPDHTQIVSDQDVGQTCLPSHIVNADRLVTYKVLDANGNAVGSPSSPLTIHESLAFVSQNNCGNGDPAPEGFGSIPGSQFQDQLNVNCPANPSQDCGFTINAGWTSGATPQFAPVTIMTLYGEVVHTGYTTVLAVKLSPKATDKTLPGTCVYPDGSEQLPGTAGCP